MICPHCGERIDTPSAIGMRERKVMVALGEGMTLLMISKLMNLNYDYIKNVAHHVYRKLDVRDRRQLVMYWQCPLFHLGLRELGFL